ncbi:asparaginase [Cytobacillus depressus]|uniref:asparaginase n=1 Tax=Cytobacillus depressus TaxID=1602942 RepID=A0A6L3V8N0_9BACI|nr:asparaginase [Cytobacillus depressus]KAB2336705.1 asparaginase [Cytobacillus depressus]
MKKIILLTTGGTIASKVNPDTGLLSSGALTGDELASMCKLPSKIGVEVESVFQIPSNQMNAERLSQLRERIGVLLSDPQVDGVVVTHGTDTLEETAYYLDLTIANEKPIVITGSQRGPFELGTDAMINIRQSILAAASDELKGFGTVVLFNERLFSARYVKKVHASNVAGFTSEGYGYLGTVDQDIVTVYQKPLTREVYSLKHDFPVVDIIPFYLGVDDRFIRTSISTGAKGMILEGSGRGHMAPEMSAAIEEACNQGIIVVLTTKAGEGEVRHVYDFPGSVFDLTNKGVLIGKDYDSKKARIKLAVLLADGASKEEIQRVFLK